MIDPDHGNSIITRLRSMNDLLAAIPNAPQRAPLTASERGEWRASVAHMVGVRRTRHGAWVVCGRRFRTMTLAVSHFNGLLVDALVNAQRL